MSESCGAHRRVMSEQLPLPFDEPDDERWLDEWYEPRRPHHHRIMADLAGMGLWGDQSPPMGRRVVRIKSTLLN
jgi:hypothetical protein